MNTPETPLYRWPDGQVRQEEPYRCGTFVAATGAQCVKLSDHDGPCEFVLLPSIVIQEAVRRAEAERLFRFDVTVYVATIDEEIADEIALVICNRIEAADIAVKHVARTLPVPASVEEVPYPASAPAISEPTRALDGGEPRRELLQPAPVVGGNGQSGGTSTDEQVEASSLCVHCGSPREEHSASGERCIWRFTPASAPSVVKASSEETTLDVGHRHCAECGNVTHWTDKAPTLCGFCCEPFAPLWPSRASSEEESNG